MAIFDQKGQQVTYQYNAAGDVNFGAVQNRIDLVQELEKFQAEMAQAIKGGVFDEEVATDAEYQLKKAVQQAKKPEPDKKSILEHLSNVKELIQGITAAVATSPAPPSPMNGSNSTTPTMSCCNSRARTRTAPPIS